MGAEKASLRSAPGKIEFRFHARDFHMVLAPAKGNSPIRFQVKLDGAAPGANCGIDSSPDGTGMVPAIRPAPEPAELKELVRQRIAEFRKQRKADDESQDKRWEKKRREISRRRGRKSKRYDDVIM